MLMLIWLRMLRIYLTLANHSSSFGGTCVLLKLAIFQMTLVMCLVILILCCRCCHKMTKMIYQLSDQGFNIFVFIIPRNIDILKCLSFIWDDDACEQEDLDIFISMLIFSPASQSSRSHL